MPGRRARRDGVDEHDALDAVAERLQQLGRLSSQLQDIGLRQQIAHALGDHEAYRVVTPERVSEADDAEARRRHARSTSSRRKCVAQEMHGS